MTVTTSDQLPSATTGLLPVEAMKRAGTMILPPSHSLKQWGRLGEILGGVRGPWSGKQAAVRWFPERGASRTNTRKLLVPVAVDDTTGSTEQGVIPRTLSESIYITRKKVIHVLLFLLGLMLGGLVGITTMCLMRTGRQ